MAENPGRHHPGRGPPDPHHSAGDTPVFTDPAGDVIPIGPDTRFRGNVAALTARNRQPGLSIGPQTPVPYWLGEGMDDSMAVEGLLQLE